jgi:uncharacterized protein
MPTGGLVAATVPSAPNVGTVGNVNFPALYQYGSYLNIMEMHWPALWFLKHPVRGLLTFQLYVVGRLMIGVAVMRTAVFTEPAHHRRALQWAAAIGLVTGFLLTEFPHAERYEERIGWISQRELWESLAAYPYQAGILLMAAGYAALFALAWEVGLWRRLFSTFVPIGQMAVTNYLLQSVFLSFVFYGFGFGLLGRLGATWCFLLSLSFFSLQCVLSYLWMRSFQFGPVEWLWRGWTYGKLPTLRRTSRISAGA